MADVGDLAVVLDARTKEFRAELDKAEKRISKFERTAEKGTAEAGRGFDRLGGRMRGLKAAVGGLVAAFGAWQALRLGKEAVAISADYESIEIQLGTLTGSAQNAASVMEYVNKAVLETPYSLGQMGRAAASSALIFKDNTGAVNEFTTHVADLAAAFKRPIELIGENLPRAFSAGLGAADAFREAGISGYILELSGKTKIADVTTQDLIDSIRKMTSEGGIAYRAAARQADSLGGVLSNTGIAADNLKRAFGEALSPAVVKTGKEVLQPFFERLKTLVEENSEALQRWAENLGTAVDWMTRIIDSGPRGYAEMVDRAAELRQEIADLNKKLALHEKLTLGISFLEAKGGKQRLADLTAELDALNKLIRAEEERMVRGGKPTSGKPEAAIDVSKLPGADRDAGKNALRQLKGMAEMAEVFGENAASAQATLQATGTAASGIAWALRDAAEQASRIGGPLEGIGEAIGQDIREGAQTGLVEGLKEGRLDAAETLGGISDSISTEFLDRGVGEMLDGLEDGFGDLFDTLGPKLGEALGMANMGPLSGAVQGAIATAAGIGISLITRQLGGTKSRQTYADIQRASATTDVREMRGIAVGETTVGIAEIGPRLEDAMAPLTGIMAEHLRVTRGILAALSGGYTRGAGAALDVEVGTLLENSPSLTY